MNSRSIFEIPDEPGEPGDEKLYRVGGKIIRAKLKSKIGVLELDTDYYRENLIKPDMSGWPDVLVKQYRGEFCDIHDMLGIKRPERRDWYEEAEPYICVGILLLMVLITILSRVFS